MTGSPPESHAQTGTSRLLRVLASGFVLILVILGILSNRRPAHALRIDVGPRRLLGTFVRVSVVVPSGQKAPAESAIEEAFDRIKQIDGLMSIYNAQSELSRLNQTGKAAVSQDTAVVLRKAREISDLTDGAFDITVRPLIRVWKAAAKNNALPTEADLHKALAFVSYKNVLLAEGDRNVALAKPGVTLDLAGIAKGYAVDAAAQVLRKNGLKNFMVEAGGEVYCSGRRDKDTPWRIGVQDPRSRIMDPKLLDMILGLSDTAVATSGNYQQFTIIGGKRYSHIVDPRTGRPADNVPGATIIAPGCMTADALATSVSVLGVKKGLELIEKLPNVEALLITVKDDALVFHKSTGFGRYVIQRKQAEQ